MPLTVEDGSKLYVRADSWQFTQRKAQAPEAPVPAAKPKAKKSK